jgi:GNAT superfamily N-acetyltransferase
LIADASSGIELAPYEEEHREGCMRLLRESFPSGYGESVWSWRFTPILGEDLIMLVALKGSRVVGFNSWTPWPYTFRGRLYRSFQLGESVVDPEFRGRGIYSKLQRLGCDISGDRGVDFFLAFPIKGTHGPLLRSGWSHVGDLRGYCKILRPFRGAAKVLSLIPRDTSRVETGAAAKRVAGEIRIPESSSARADRFARVNSPEFLRWRFAENAYHRYSVHRHTEEDGEAIFIYRARERKGLNECFLVDFHRSGEDPIFFSRALGALVAHARRGGFDLLTTAFTPGGRILTGAFRENLFFPVPGKSILFTVHPLGLGERERGWVLDLERWALRPADVDAM